MTTTKKRINISVSKRVGDTLAYLAKRDQEPVATKAADLLERALDIEEDRVLGALAEKRDTKGVRWVTSERVWGKKRTRIR